MNNKNIKIDISKVPDILRDKTFREIHIFALGPEGTNISQAAYRWAEEERILNKSNIILCDTPEQEIEWAMQVKEKGVLPIFALCAVYYDLCKVFFRHLENYTFLHHYYMQLDNMQLASQKYTQETLKKNATVAAHFSPSILLEETEYILKKANSNSAAAKMCALGEVDACITTESACKLYGLETIEEYGAPNMLFTFGTTDYGVEQIYEVINKRKK